MYYKNKFKNIIIKIFKMKYNIEGGIDFYKELNSCLKEESSKKEEDLNKCLITHSELKEFYIELGCGHKFNYGPLYKDIYNYKKKLNFMEQSVNKLKVNEIRCPYCRKIFQQLLPYHENLPYPKEHGVNYIDDVKMGVKQSNIADKDKCQYESLMTDNLDNTFINKCFNYGYVHLKLKEKYNNTNKYCYHHKLIVLKEIQKEEKEKKKLEKINLKEELKKQKQENKQKILENLSNNLIINNEYCIEILKTGKRKGMQCLVKIFENCLCKKHFNLKNK